MEQHRPVRVRLKDGTRLDEPPGVEGYLDRIRPTSQIRHSMYISTHDGYLFFLDAAQALTPNPPGLPPSSTDTTDLRKGEVLRGAQQILRATGLTDLRNVLAVRRAFQLVPIQTEEITSGHAGSEESEQLWAQPESFEDDHDDIGGEDGLNQARDRMQRRLRRSFELLLTSGQVVRLEVRTLEIHHIAPGVLTVRRLSHARLLLSGYPVSDLSSHTGKSNTRPTQGMKWTSCMLVRADRGSHQ